MGNVSITAKLSDEVVEKFHALAEQRYGSRTQESYDRLLEDIVRTKMQEWDRDGIGLQDKFWGLLAYYAPLPWLRQVAWGKIIASYFKEVI